MERDSTNFQMQTDREFKPNIIKKEKSNALVFNTFRNVGKAYAAEQEIRPFKKPLLSYKKNSKALR